MVDKNTGVKPLHLYSIESLLAELIGGGGVSVAKGSKPFSLQQEASKAVLAWYGKNRTKWAANLSALDVDAVVTCVGLPVPAQMAELAQADGPKKHYALTRVRVHRFAGIHTFGTRSDAPEDFDYTMTRGVTVFEGFNGAGKTSLLNAIVWCLTGMLLRPQRAPESGEKEFEVELLHEGANEASSYKLSSVTPMPDASIENLDGTTIPADSWVELTFTDSEGNAAAPIRRSQSRTGRGVLQQTVPDFKSLMVDMQALRIGTVIPALLPFSQVGSQSDLGKAVAQLTGLAPLADLAKHARKMKERIAKVETKDREKEIGQSDQAFQRDIDDLAEIAEQNPGLKLDAGIPHPKGGDATETAVGALKISLAERKSDVLRTARAILGQEFEAEKHGRSFEQDVRDGFTAVQGLGNTVAARRLTALRKVSAAESTLARELIDTTLSEAASLVILEKTPGTAARERLYAAIAQWYFDNGYKDADLSSCAVCGGSLEEVVDEETGKRVKDHLHSAVNGNAAVISQTFDRWSAAAVAKLSSSLDETLSSELRRDLSEEPFDLMHQALVAEVLNAQAFKGALNPLVTLTREASETKRAASPLLEGTALLDLQERLKKMPALQKSIERLDRALRISGWAQTSRVFAQDFFETVVGRPAADKPAVAASLLGRLASLERIVEEVQPIDAALKMCKRLQDDVAGRRRIEARLKAYDVAIPALEECSLLGGMAEQQVAELQETLHSATEAWRTTIYQAGYPNASHDLTSTAMRTDGQVEFWIGSNGASAPAQHVANASALRATLIAFYMAYWEYLRHERGGLDIIVLDDPQELLDGDNKERLAKGIVNLVGHGAQPIITTHDSRFARHVVLECQGQTVPIEHREVHPATRKRPTLTTSPSVIGVEKAKKAAIESEWTVSGFAQDYAGRAREFIEARLGDFFDDAGNPATSAHKLKPTLSDFVDALKGSVRTGSTELFKAKNVVALAKDPGLDPKSTVYALLNKAHHASRTSILPTEVYSVASDLERMCALVEGAHQDFRTYCRREFLKQPSVDLDPLPIEQIGHFELPVQPNLAAFVRGGAYGESQETDLETLSSTWFDGKAAFFLRTTNFGFASTVQGVAIVEATASDVADRSLVIARGPKATFARRLYRAKDGGRVSLATETPDPRFGRKTLSFDGADVALHLVVGMLFWTDVKPAGKSVGEAEQVDLGTLLQRVKSAYRVKEESAVPLALDGQVALGGEILNLAELDLWLDHYVAVHLSDGHTLFKRVGKSLPGELRHLRQFETIGGLGSSDVLAVEKEHHGVARVEAAVLILGVLYV